MRITRLLVATLAGLLSTSLVHSDTATELRLMTYNIRYDTTADGENAWPHRRDAVINLIRFYGPDILGTQEAKAHQKDWMLAALPAFQTIGVGRKDGQNGGEFSSLFIKRERFELHDSGTFWLSTTPHEPSKGWDAAFPRIATWARITDRRTGLRYLAVNTHWDHRGNEARIQGAKLIHRWMVENSKRGERLILMGDLNATPSTTAYQVLLEDGLLTNARTISEIPPFGPGGTFNAFEVARNDEEPIDHILLSPEIAVIRHGVITQHVEGRLPSDHYPVMAEIR